MFEQNYKNAMDKITPDADTRDKILDKIILKEEIRTRKNPAIPWRVAFACVACVAIILGVVFVPRNTDKSSSVNAPTTLRVSYNEIYELIREKNEKSFWEYIMGDDGLIKKVKKKVVLSKDDAVEYIVEEEIVYEGAVDVDTEAGTSSSTNGSSNQNDGNASAPTNKNEADDFSNTTEQVEGVHEADIVKTDGKHIYYLIGNELSVFKANGDASTFVGRTIISDSDYNYSDMFLKDDRLIILQYNGLYNGCYVYGDDYTGNDGFVSVIIYDVSNPAKISKVSVSKQQGSYNSSRMVGDYIYLISNCEINISEIKKTEPATFVPTIEINDVCKTVPADSIYRYEQDEYENAYTVIGAFNYKDGTMSDTASLLGGTDNVYCSKGNIILANTTYSDGSEAEGTYSRNNTTVSRLEIKNGKIEYKATGEIEGALENQFYIDEHNGHFRFVTTVTLITQTAKTFDDSEEVYIVEESLPNNTSARLTILDSNLKKTGEIKDLAKGERVYSVRFMGDVAYFVTFRQTDPLFSADLSDPKNPKILGELKIPGFSEYMYPYGDGLLLGFGMDASEITGRTSDLKLSMFNIADPANVTEQDKTVINGYNYSTALDNHKAMLVSPTKNLIGFATYDPTYNASSETKYKYMIYEYMGNTFTCKAKISIPWDNNKNFYYDSIRGLFINDYFYVVSAQSLQVFDINGFNQIAQIHF